MQPQQQSRRRKLMLQGLRQKRGWSLVVLALPDPGPKWVETLDAHTVSARTGIICKYFTVYCVGSPLPWTPGCEAAATGRNVIGHPVP